MPDFTHRLARPDDLDPLREVMRRSIESLQDDFLTPEQVAASHKVMGLDAQLVLDGTYFIVESEDRIAGCGGWSWRSTLYGGDESVVAREPRALDAATEPARIRAMYTHPDHARRGIGRLVLSLCEAAAAHEGFRMLELVATVAGEPLYTACGYALVERIEVPTSRGVFVPCARMRKAIAPA